MGVNIANMLNSTTSWQIRIKCFDFMDNWTHLT